MMTAPGPVRTAAGTFLMLWVQLLLAPAVMAGGELEAFLERTVRMATHNRPVRADIKITRNNASEDRALLMIDPERGRQFFAARNSGWRSLLPLTWGKGVAVTSASARPSSLGTDERLAGSDLRGMEIFPFWQTDDRTAFISDDNRTEKTVTIYMPETTPYSLLVLTFDRAKMVPTMVKYYKDTMSNLVRLRQDYDFVMVGSRPRPGRINIRDFSTATETRVELSWTVLTSVPAELMAEDTFVKAEIDWNNPSKQH